MKLAVCRRGPGEVVRVDGPEAEVSRPALAAPPVGRQVGAFVRALWRLGTEGGGRVGAKKRLEGEKVIFSAVFAAEKNCKG